MTDITDERTDASSESTSEIAADEAASTGGPTCTLSEAEADARSERLRAELFPPLEDIEERPDGFTFRFERDRETYDAVAEIAWLEAGCCAFATHEVEIPAGSGPIAWHWHTDGDGKEVLREAAGRFDELTLPS